MSVNPSATVTNLLINTLASNKIVFLPAASTMSGHLYTIKDICGNAAASSIFVSTVGLDTIDSSATRAIMSTTFGGVTMASDGRTNWMVLQHKIFNAFFTPSQISGLQVWYDASDPSTMTLSGSTVTEWRDKSGNAFTLTGSGSAQLQSFNARTVMFLNNGPYFQNTVFTNSGPYAVFIIFKFDTLPAAWLTLLDNVSPLRPYVGFEQNTATRTAFRYGGSATTNPEIWSLQYSASDLTIFNVAGTSVIGAVTGYGGIGHTNGLRVGFAGNNTAPMIGWIGEIVYYSGTLSSSQREQMEGYLSWKWGLQANLPTNHPFRRIRP